MADYDMVVLTNPVAGREDEYNDWYDNQHLDEVLQVPGFVRARRFVNDDPMATKPPEFKYLAIYEIESDDIKATLAGFRAAARTMHMSPAMDTAGVIPVLYRALGKARERAG
jgi:hypothetical protein